MELPASQTTIAPIAPLPANLKEASDQFEAIFLRQFLEKAMKPVLHSTPGSNSAGAGMYRYLMTDTLATSLASGGQFGFSNLLQMQLAENSVSSPAGQGSLNSLNDPSL